jgi:hypothetical protein
MAMADKSVDRFLNYDLRCCRTMLHCAICDRAISYGEQYYDGGYGRRAHEFCVNEALMEEANGNGR